MDMIPEMTNRQLLREVLSRLQKRLLQDRNWWRLNSQDVMNIVFLKSFLKFFYSFSSSQEDHMATNAAELKVDLAELRHFFKNNTQVFTLFFSALILHYYQLNKLHCPPIAVYRILVRYKILLPYEYEALEISDDEVEPMEFMPQEEGEYIMPEEMAVLMED